MIIDNENIILKDVLKEWIEKSDEILICSPFISPNDVLFNLLERQIKLTLICRLSPPATPELFAKLKGFMNGDKQIYIYDDSSLHSKIYFFRKNEKALVAIIGSSNFTGSGIYSNKEYNKLVTTDLNLVDEYFKHLVNNSFSVLNEGIIDYYKTFYKEPERNERYKRAKISPKLSKGYSNTLDKFYITKGILEEDNKTILPFTYVFDSFCHFFKTKMVGDFEIKPMDRFDKSELKKYFNLFLRDYLKKEDKIWRESRYNQSVRIRTKLESLESSEIKDFFLGIHSVVSGSGASKRKENIKSIDKSKLIKLLDFLINENLSMPHKYSIALTKREEHGLKIDYLGESAIGEIPGWLMPETYPIKNSKLHYVFDFFKL